MRYFLLEAAGDRTKVRIFEDRDYRKALDAYQEREMQLFPWWGDAPRVCLFRADSLATLRRTHSNWFGSILEVA